MTDALYDRLSRLLAKGHEQDANPPWRDWRRACLVRRRRRIA